MRPRFVASIMVLLTLAAYVGLFNIIDSNAQTIPEETAIVYLPLIASLPTPQPTNTPGDSEPPRIITWSFNPTALDTTSPEPAIIVKARFTDDLIGVKNGYFAYARFYSPNTSQEVQVDFKYPTSLISGNAQDGIYQTKMSVPRFLERGEWKLHKIYMEDNEEHAIELWPDDALALGLPTSFRVIK